MKLPLLCTLVALSAGAAVATAWTHRSAFCLSPLAVVQKAAPAAADESQENEDVTTKYLSNPSFEQDDISRLTATVEQADGLRGYAVTAPAGWTVGGTAVKSLIVTADCYTDNNFGKVTTVPDGSQAYYLRQGWADGSTRLAQKVASLPAGKYRLQARVHSAYANSANSAYALFAGDQTASGAFEKGTAGCFASTEWETLTLDFEQKAEAGIELGLTVDWKSGGSCIAIDDIRLVRLSDSYVEPEEPTETAVASPTEDVIKPDFVAEADMKADLMGMMARFAQYMKADYQDCAAPNSVGEACGAFRSNSSMTNGEDGVRPNADLSMLCAFLSKYGKGQVELPAGVSWDDIDNMAMKSLIFAYSTHKANKLKVCAGNNYWGSVSGSDHVWESSLWAMSVAYSAYFQWDRLTDKQKGYVEKLLKAECNYELNRTIPTGYNGDTKAEENGWEVDVLAATLGLFPDDPLAPKWYERLREFAINSYSHKDDAADNTVIDPEYDQKTVADLYKGQNLFDDYTLQNHNFFHTSYQNVVIQELGEAALALKLFQQMSIGQEKWKTNALMHNNDKVMKQVLNWLALADGELAMPNGNDWSLFLYDQITSYTTNACFLDDPDALMLENLAYKYIKARQTTTTDGSWLLRSDIGARRMGVEAHRVMMTWLMHEVLPTAGRIQPSTWDEFNRRHAQAYVFPCQNIVRAATDDRFTCFSWSAGKQSYTGYIAANSADKNKIIVPYRANNTGNYLGWYTVNGKNTNATAVVSGVYALRGNSYTMNGELNVNDGTLNNRFAIYSTPGNAVIYTDYVRANSAVTITGERGGLMAISTDELTRPTRTLYYADGDKTTHKQSNGSRLVTINSHWTNIDNALGVVNVDGTGMAFGDRAENNSIMTSKLYAAYSTQSRAVKAGDVAGRRNIVYYSNVDAAQTGQLAAQAVSLAGQAAAGWNGTIARDPSGISYMLLANFCGDSRCTLQNIQIDGAAPVFSADTYIDASKATATFAVDANHAVGDALLFGIQGTGLRAVQDAADSTLIYVSNTAGGTNGFTVVAQTGTRQLTADFSVKNGKTLAIRLVGDKFETSGADYPSKADVMEGYTDVTGQKLSNPSFENDVTYGDATGNVTLNGITYKPCYVNTVAAADKNFINVLPVEGWTTRKTLQGSSNFCRMFSMPYSTSMYCVSPSSQGNYVTQCAAPALDEGCGARCLTVLNSWSKGDNAIVQTLSLQPGTYRLVFDMKYECSGQTANDGRKVTTSNNTNTSLTGVKIGSTTDYRYPSQANEWQQMVYDFTLDTAQDVQLSLGYSTSASQGAANNTLLFIDNVRLGVKETTAIGSVEAGRNGQEGVAYTLGGARTGIPSKGLYIIGGQKILRR